MTDEPPDPTIERPVLLIHALQGGGKPNVLADGVRSLRENLALMIEHAELMAEVQRAKFVALKKAGFTDAQALELCRSI